MSSPIVPVVLCGGAGTRLWPTSRESLPKPFAPLLGERSTFRATLERLDAPGLFARPVVVTHRDARFAAADDIARAGLEADILLEPERRDTAAAVAAGALHANLRGPDTLVLVTPADHLVPEADDFRAACREAAEGARAGLIMTFGVAPDRPASEFGYVVPGAPVLGRIAHAARFVEKPDREAALGLLRDGALWNAGCFLARADTLLDEIDAHAPAVAEAARRAYDAAVLDLDFIRLGGPAYAHAPRTAFDRAVMELTSRAAVLPVAFAWSDIGTWSALRDALPRDSNGNALRGRVEAVDARDCLVLAQDTLTAVVGLDDAVVVVEPDAVLVTTRSRAGDVGALVAELRARGRPEASEHLRLHGPWGWHQRMDGGERFRVKRLCVRPGGQLSLQRHEYRSEHWVVVRGFAEVTLGNEVRLLGENEAAYIPAGMPHRLANPGAVPLEVVEVQVGAYTGEDDIVRLEDAYGRA